MPWDASTSDEDLMTAYGGGDAGAFDELYKRHKGGVYRYLLRQFLQSFLICFISLTGLFIVIDAFANLEEFINYAQKQGSLLGVIGTYYAYRSLMFSTPPVT